MQEYGFSLTLTLPYKARKFSDVLRGYRKATTGVMG